MEKDSQAAIKNTGVSSSDTVSISDEGRKAAFDDSAGKSTTGNASSGVEKYQIPGWQAQYMNVVKPVIGASPLASNESTGRLSSESERIEYANLIDQHYSSVLKSNGIEGVDAHYEATIVNKEFSESLRQQMKESIMGDSRLLELMSKMGKSPV
ncbi:hypothetical protein DNK06_15760 [Pseudomonas daroniae]|uniref:Uncharacterized protein n=1 Tax=Phytopseudomonas daroniae TaxID=2487519 RepID=A0A4Q9QK57_9GAMM|nr:MULTISPECIES: hypothetical protein [Pseudomonas]TBU76325.1 hypothetical protein DNK10_10165 [Pseudomonas daroniae]TBU76745.1 hypothetical protein DNK06_15760 [Pseudomonas daroniae]TBU81316.1 hypothetical protein DNK31_14475 [Pseudomonas sp. FRB 228]TBU90477.1 hypothetical protein DNJ99_13620 [Pseudomonas daroniae]